ncbi:MAG TPA: hypothetical protein VHU86_08725 [Solirubrobacterales bacterium]|nr:hypothetical protein [Solirubrobacterales bacterium]
MKNPLRSLPTLGLALTMGLFALALSASSANATPTHPFDESLSHPGAFNRPCGTATDPEGDLYVIDQKGVLA